MIASNFWFIGKAAHLASYFGDCVYRGEPVFYAPWCPNSMIASDFVNGFVTLGNYGWGMYGITTVWGGTWAAEAWYAAAADVREVHGNAFWLSF